MKTKTQCLLASSEHHVQLILFTWKLVKCIFKQHEIQAMIIWWAPKRTKVRPRNISPCRETLSRNRQNSSKICDPKNMHSWKIWFFPMVSPLQKTCRNLKILSISDDDVYIKSWCISSDQKTNQFRYTEIFTWFRGLAVGIVQKKSFIHP